MKVTTAATWALAFYTASAAVFQSASGTSDDVVTPSDVPESDETMHIMADSVSEETTPIADDATIPTNDVVFSPTMILPSPRILVAEEPSETPSSDEVAPTPVEDGPTTDQPTTTDEVILSTTEPVIETFISRPTPIAFTPEPSVGDTPSPDPETISQASPAPIAATSVETPAAEVTSTPLMTLMETRTFITSTRPATSTTTRPAAVTTTAAVQAKKHRRRS